MADRDPWVAIVRAAKADRAIQLTSLEAQRMVTIDDALRSAAESCTTECVCDIMRGGVTCAWCEAGNKLPVRAPIKPMGKQRYQLILLEEAGGSLILDPPRSQATPREVETHDNRLKMLNILVRRGMVAREVRRGVTRDGAKYTITDYGRQCLAVYNRLKTQRSYKPGKPRSALLAGEPKQLAEFMQHRPAEKLDTWVLGSSGVEVAVLNAVRAHFPDPGHPTHFVVWEKHWVHVFDYNELDYCYGLNDYARRHNK